MPRCRLILSARFVENRPSIESSALGAKWGSGRITAYPDMSPTLTPTLTLLSSNGSVGHGSVGEVWATIHPERRNAICSVLTEGLALTTSTIETILETKWLFQA
jgi:hypothetical protein